MITNDLSNIPVATLRRVIELREQIEGLQQELSALVSGAPAPEPTLLLVETFTESAPEEAPVAEEAPAEAAPAPSGRGRKVMSPAARAAIAAAQKARWAKFHKSKGTAKPAAAAKAATPGKRKMSPEGRAAIAAAAKARWARERAQKGN